MKYAFYQLEHGRPFVEGDLPPEQKGIHIEYHTTHNFYSNELSRYKNYARIAIIRDPARRIISAFNHRVVRERELAASRINMDLALALGVGPDPTRSEFLCNIEKYRVLSKSIRHHTDPFTKFLGHDLSYFTDVVKMGKIPELAQQIETLTGRKFEVAHFHKANVEALVLKMGPAARNALLSYCAGDYALMKGYFSIPKVLQDG